MRSRRLWTRHAAFIIVIAILGTIVTAGAVIAGPKFLKKSKYTNTTGIFAAQRTGPVNLTPGLTEMAAFTVPKGKYAVNAKLFTENLDYPNDVNRQYVCQLRQGGATLDQSEEGIGVDLGERHVTIALQGVVEFAGNGTLSVFCSDNAPAADNDDKARFIKITAVRSKTLSSVAIP
jgi:hypothetical protein